MYIKTLTIQGFKSYRDQVAIEPFSPGHNVIVGRNGSGKSNFFSAIRFVLSDAYVSMSREERQALLHDSSTSTSTTLSAFVEIVFDNSDARFPTNGAEVILRRTIGLKKDEYSIDRRSASKADVANLLEAAGFSRSNPYYIVPQGRITHLTNIKDSERLNLLKEVAGTKVYEQRRSESLKIMNETDSKRSKIVDLLKYIAERLAELDEEKEELKNYYEKDKDRRCLEYAIYQREMQEVTILLDELESHKTTDAEASSARRVEFRDREKDLAAKELDLTETKQKQSQLQLEKETLIEERRELARTLAQLEAQVRDDDESGERREERLLELQSRLEEVEGEITEKEAELMAVEPDLQEKSQSLTSRRQDLEDVKARLGVLLAKGGRSAQFRSESERDAALKTQISELKAFERAQERRQKDVEIAEEASASKLGEVEAAIAAREAQLEQRRRTKQDATRAWTTAKARREELIEQKKELWKEETKLTSSTAYASEQLNNANRSLAGTMDRTTSQGLSAIERIVRDNNIIGCHGPLYKLFSVDSRYQTAAEVTANASLFHVVVDDENIASQILEVMNRERSGRVTFMPLSRLKPKELNFPSASDAIPLLSKLRYDSQYEAAMKQVFGQMVLCSNLDVASAYVRSHGVNTVTMEGDKVEKRGALTGGYHDPRRSRLDSIRDVKRWSEMLDTDRKRLAELHESTAEIEQEVTTLTGEVATLEAKIQQASTTRGPLLEEIQWLRSEEVDARKQLSTIVSELATLQRSLKSAVAQREALEQEIKTPMRQGLTNAEQTERDSLYGQEDTLGKQVMELAFRVAELTTQRDALKIDLDEQLKREKEILQGQMEDLQENLGSGDPSGSSDAGSRREELRRVKKQHEDRKKALAKLDRLLDDMATQMQSLQEAYDKTYAEQLETARAIEKQQKSIDRYMSKRQRYLEQKDKCNGHIRDLGVLPEEAFEKYTTTNLDRLLKRLHKVNDSLKDFSHVNKKAVEQYNNFTKQREQLLQRQGDLEKSAESIQELIEVLDQRKDEAIERTFKQVSKNFEEVFAKLVPAGRGRLIMQRRIDRAEDEESDEEIPEAGRSSAIDSYTGVSIKVSFNSKIDEGLRIQQLSGGQKSLVALATVFAIQKCDPAPFYLFDEIDANLDAQYRTAVAGMIHELSQGDNEGNSPGGTSRDANATSGGAQFITTTFRPEMVAVAEKHYGVLFNAQKISSIRSISREEANSFVEAAADPDQTGPVQAGR